MRPDQTSTGTPIQHDAPWWFRLAERLMPGRCREIPEAQNPDRIVLRQFAIVKRYVYLQNFASSEDSRFMHSHQWHRTIAIGLWGSYVERRIAGPDKTKRAPYLYTMDASVVHHVQNPSPGHTSLFVGLWRNDDLKFYYGAPGECIEGPECLVAGQQPRTRRRSWDKHIRKMVKRI